MQAHKVRAMPTFVLVKNGEQVCSHEKHRVYCNDYRYPSYSSVNAQVDRVEGFREANIRAMIAKHRTSPSGSGVKKGD